MPKRRRRKWPQPRGSLAGPVRWERIACGRITSAGRLAFRVPHVQTPDMKLNALAACRADTLHHKLRLGDDFLAGVTRLAVARPTPQARDAVLGQPTVSKLGSNEATKDFLFHGDEGSPGMACRREPPSRGSRRPVCANP